MASRFLLLIVTLTLLVATTVVSAQLSRPNTPTTGGVQLRGGGTYTGPTNPTTPSGGKQVPP
jgi:hypothetical protein